MNKFRDFISNQVSIIAVVMAQLFLFFLIFKLEEFDRKIYYLALEITAFALLIFMMARYLTYDKKVKIKEENAELRRELESLRMKSISEQKVLQEYFLMWVHQIKTPITASKLILQEEIHREEQSELKAQMMYIEDYTTMAISYLKLMNTNTDMDITQVAVDEVVQSVLRKYATLFIKNHITAEYHGTGERVYSDTKWLSILLEQLISNALKYTKEGKIEISYNGKLGELSVKDSGIGIRSEDLPKIFDKGYSGFNGRLDQKSSGLGLFLAGQIADKLNVEIRVESGVGRGSCFSVSNLTKV